MSDDVIIIKKVVKGGHGHHGGAWKVAYADFVTAMMAFFLLMWPLNATTEDQKKGISDYFSPVSVSTGTGVSLKLEPTTGAQAGDAEEEGGANDKAATAEDSSERAQASRRVLASTGLFPDRISSVAGRAALDPLLPDDTRSPRNRRISILLLRRKVTEKAEAVKKAEVAKARRTAKRKKPVPVAPKQDWTGPRIRQAIVPAISNMLA